MDRKWYYIRDTEKLGPVSESVLAELLSVSEITPDTQVWREGLGEWRNLSSCRELSESLGIALTPPPIPNRDLNQNHWREPTSPTKPTTDQLNANGRPNSKIFLTSCFAFGLVLTLIQGEFYSISGGIGYALGISASLILFTYLISAIPLIGYYILKKRRAPFEAKLVWSVLIIISVLAIAGSTMIE